MVLLGLAKKVGGFLFQLFLIVFIVGLVLAVLGVNPLDFAKISLQNWVNENLPTPQNVLGPVVALTPEEIGPERLYCFYTWGVPVTAEQEFTFGKDEWYEKLANGISANKRVIHATVPVEACWDLQPLYSQGVVINEKIASGHVGDLLFRALPPEITGDELVEAGISIKLIKITTGLRPEGILKETYSALSQAAVTESENNQKTQSKAGNEGEKALKEISGLVDAALYHRISENRPRDNILKQVLYALFVNVDDVKLNHD